MRSAWWQTHSVCYILDLWRSTAKSHFNWTLKIDHGYFAECTWFFFWPFVIGRRLHRCRLPSTASTYQTKLMTPGETNGYCISAYSATVRSTAWCTGRRIFTPPKKNAIKIKTCGSFSKLSTCVINLPLFLEEKYDPHDVPLWIAPPLLKFNWTIISPQQN